MAPGAMSNKNNVLPLWGNDKTMNLNNLILTNIQSSHYFKVNLFELKSYHEVIDEIYYKVSHLEPWEKGSRKTSGQTGMCGGVRGVGAGGIVSTAFCLLYKLFTLKLTRKQLNGLITHCDSPYIRALGFMYIRYTQPPADLWEWFEGYLDDEEELDVKAGGGCIMTIGEMLRHFLGKLEWYSTLFPRIPVPIQKDIEKKLAERGPLLRAGVRKDGSGGMGSGGGGSDADSPSLRLTGSGDNKERHIPDEEVSWGEAERIARLRRSVSREKRVRKDDDWKNGNRWERDREEEHRRRYEKDNSSYRDSDRRHEHRSSHHYHHHHSSSRDSDHRSHDRLSRTSSSRSHRSDSRDRHRSRSRSREHQSKDNRHQRSSSYDRNRDKK